MKSKEKNINEDLETRYSSAELAKATAVATAVDILKARIDSNRDISGIKLHSLPTIDESAHAPTAPRAQRPPLPKLLQDFLFVEGVVDAGSIDCATTLG